ncbi:MAG: chemotaxis protein CheW [Deltaproteobacteria bacterium]|nr:chemotaxis protein CheW [Deltaproteobacteria bacterium]
MSELDETIKEFLVESLENLEQLDRELLALESDPTKIETINTIFRIVHTVKGTCGFFDFRKLEKVSHVGENLLDSLRSQKIAVTEVIITTLLRLSDTLRELLANIEESGCEGDGDYSELVGLLTSLNEQKITLTSEAISINSKSEGSVDESSVVLLKTQVSEEGQDDELQRMFYAAQSEWQNASSLEAPGAAAVPESSQIGAAENQAPSTVADGSESPKVSESKKSELSESSLRVDVNLLDKLMNLVGELVLARNQILQFTKSQNDGEFASTSQRLNLITSELQEGVMRTRMQPISTVWNKLPRIVRDIAHSCGKKVVLEMQGKETELDKTIIEAIKDPLTHVIRNSVDHGIESPEKRLAAGKGAEGVLVMRAFHEGGQVVIEISDDGAGLNTERIRAKALEKGLITSDKAASMGEAEVNRLIFLPGFSTAEQITNISGRGVGMDVVRSNIERIGGAVDVASNPGKGAKFTIKIPLTLAIIPALIVTTNNNRYAIPQVNLLELVRIEGAQLKQSIERIQGSDFYRLRGKILPLVYLDEQLGLSAANSTKSGGGILNLVVVRADNHQFGLVVDAIHDTEEIVVKPLGRLLKGISAFAGATIMGDGQVALILDIVGMARKAQIAKKEAAAKHEESRSNDEGKTSERKKMFVFELGTNKRAAVPLDQVYRLEEFPVQALESAGDHIVVQYRDGILPLVDLRGIYGEPPEISEGSLRAFVHLSGDRFVGFVVERILDIVEQCVNVERPYPKQGLVGSAVIQDKVTDLLDLSAILQLAELSPKHSFDAREAR